MECASDFAEEVSLFVQHKRSAQPSNVIQTCRFVSLKYDSTVVTSTRFTEKMRW
jgi:hypothetical protein